MPDEQADEHRKIFVVEDDELVRSMIDHALKSAGYDTMLYANAEEALKALETDESCALVITDNHMPGMDGATFIGKIRDMDAPPSVLAISGIASGDLKIADATLPKPFGKQEFLDCVKNLITG